MRLSKQTEPWYSCGCSQQAESMLVVVCSVMISKYSRLFFFHHHMTDRDWSQYWDALNKYIFLFFSSCWWHVSFYGILTHFHLAENMKKWLIYYCQHSLSKTGSVLCLAICAIWIIFTFHSWRSVVTAILYVWLGERIRETNKARKHKNCISYTNRGASYRAVKLDMQHCAQLLYCGVSSYICVYYKLVDIFYVFEWVLRKEDSWFDWKKYGMVGISCCFGLKLGNRWLGQVTYMSEKLWDKNKWTGKGW